MRLAGADHRIGDGEGVDEAAAGGREIEAEAALDAELRLDAKGGGGESLVRGGGAEDDGVHVRGGGAGIGQGGAGGLGCHHGAGFVRPGDVALADTGAVDDPGVRGDQAGGQFGIGDDASGQVAADAGKNAADHKRPMTRR
jgi:hypothetical protein